MQEGRPRKQKKSGDFIYDLEGKQQNNTGNARPAHTAVMLSSNIKNEFAMNHKGKNNCFEWPYIYVTFSVHGI